MATRITGGYEINIKDKQLGDYSATLLIYIGGMMSFAYDDINISEEDEIALLEEVVGDLNALIENKKAKG